MTEWEYLSEREREREREREGVCSCERLGLLEPRSKVREVGAQGREDSAAGARCEYLYNGRALGGLFAPEPEEPSGCSPPRGALVRRGHRRLHATAAAPNQVHAQPGDGGGDQPADKPARGGEGQSGGLVGYK